MSFGKTTPILRILEEGKALAFYVDFLGFRIDWQHRFEPGFPLYLQVSRGDCVLHLSEHAGDAAVGAALRIETDELEAFRGQLLEKATGEVPLEIQAMPWGSLDMTLHDPFGNRLVFTNAICA
ncbi:VOC family protein [Pseudomonas gingeri]|uniref:Bleomycin resistance protein n=1 Tax=Pseudomonas gingeri TaxID=117681 RepID=A0A7Y7XCM5_9PSED|nr:glyoxalase superfamily protein [Pseudomonas gingeri]NWA29023.1 VOC family protein [Pseudomonas gingeri]NWB97165.1 VOC family protein [Pseudomonas gingeri]NWD66117.1 VOC family protein [Pseudomonas gingeri]NWD73537.1 VOC family protein [Pseudomonas gingeri]